MGSGAGRAGAAVARCVLLLLALGCDDAPADRSAADEHADASAHHDHHADGAVLHDPGDHSQHGAASGDTDVDAAAAAFDGGLDALRARGEYLVRHVAGCMECHTPRLTIGKFDETQLLAGVRALVDVEPDDDRHGLLHSRNLTPDRETGLGEWSDDEIKNAFLHGKSRDDRVLHWMMPSWIYHNMTIEDVAAVIAFLRSVPAVHNDVPDSQPLSTPLTTPYHLPDDIIPHSRIDPFLPEFQRAERGRYLAASAGLCVFCHTPPADDPGMPVDVTRLFMGRRKMVPVRLGTESELEDPKEAPRIETRNLTPHATGLGEWSAMDVANALRFGVSRSGLPVCDPMPSTFGGSLVGLTQEDALDIGAYLTTLVPKDSGEIPACCTACHGDMDADGGVGFGGVTMP